MKIETEILSIKNPGVQPNILVYPNTLVQELIDGNYFNHVWIFYEQYFHISKFNTQALKYMFLYSRYRAINMVCGKHPIDKDPLENKILNITFLSQKDLERVKENIDNLFVLLKDFKLDIQVAQIPKFSEMELHSYTEKVRKQIENLHITYIHDPQ